MLDKILNRKLFITRATKGMSDEAAERRRVHKIAKWHLRIISRSLAKRLCLYMLYAWALKLKWDARVGVHSSLPFNPLSFDKMFFMSQRDRIPSNCRHFASLMPSFSHVFLSVSEIFQIKKCENFANYNLNIITKSVHED